jgi:methionyl-tRNA synthetase
MTTAASRSMGNTWYLLRHNAIPYVNTGPHLGHALELVQADVLTRHQRLCGDRVCFLAGTDDNALKNVTAAKAAGVTVREFVDANAALFVALHHRSAGQRGALVAA